MQSVLSGQTVNSHFAVAPFNYYELRVPGIHKVLNSYETDGKHTNGIQVTTKTFHDANPLICRAVRAAHEEANAFIKREPKAAAASAIADPGGNRRDGALRMPGKLVLSVAKSGLVNHNASNRS
jgi:ABC-type nitrate/sulfonate/bicarbonate transport system substrate-binding protein